MTNKQALIIGFCVIIGFVVKPISELDFTDPEDRLIKVVRSVDYTDSDGGGFGYSYEFYMRAGDHEWEMSNKYGYYHHGETISIKPADEYALQTILEIQGRY